MSAVGPVRDPVMSGRASERPPRIDHWLLAMCVVVTLIHFTSPNASLTPIFAGGAVLLASMVGEARVAMYCFALSATYGTTLVAGVPAGVVAPTAMVIGALTRGMAQGGAVTRDVPLIGLVLAVVVYWWHSPPETNAGFATAYSLTLLPYCIFATRTLLLNAKAMIDVVEAFTAGLSVSIGLGLWQAYLAVNQSYNDYREVRVFESSIGSSNFAGGLASVVGVLLLSLSVGRVRKQRWLWAILSLPFLAAPFVFASRGALLAALFGLVTIAFRGVYGSRTARGGNRRSRLPVMASAAVAIPLVFVFASEKNWFIWQRLTGPTQAQIGFSSGRTDLWKLTLDIAYERWLFGAGPGGVTDLLLAASGFAYSHNIVLDLITQLGFFAGLVYVALILPRPISRWSIVWPALLTIMLHSLVEPNMSTANGAVIYAGLVACHAGVSDSLSRRVRDDLECP